MTRTTTLTSDLDAHLHVGGHPIRFISADEMAYYQARATNLRAKAIDGWLRTGARGIASLFHAAPALPNRVRGGKLLAAE